MQFVILKDEYELDQYGVEIKHKIATECNEYLQTGECSLTIRPADSPDVVHVDENEVPDDVKTVLMKQEKNIFLLYPERQKKEQQD